jgi:hypothetical protein
MDQGNGLIEASRGSHFDSIKGRIVGKLRNVADRLSDETEQKLPAHDWIEDIATRIEGLDPEKIKDDVVAEVRRNPGRAVLVALGAGFLIGAICRQR